MRKLITSIVLFTLMFSFTACHYYSDNYYEINYLLDGQRGNLDGDSKQVIKENDYTSQVRVVAKEGYEFIGWNDGEKSQERIDKVTGDKIYIALFRKINIVLSFFVNEPCAGRLVGNLNQTLNEGETSSEVLAVPYLGYKFISWSNGMKENPLKLSIFDNTSITAIFEIDCLTLPMIEIFTKDNLIINKDEYVDCSISLTNSDEKYCFNNACAKIKGRGNTTWSREEKKPYKIKFDNKINVLGLGNGKTKKWVLLADADDHSLLRNYTALTLQNRMSNLPWSSNCKSVEVFLNGEYRGVYLLAEQVEVDKYRVNISDGTDDIDTSFLVELSQYSDASLDTYLEVLGKKYELHSELSSNAEIRLMQKHFITTFLEDCWKKIENGNKEEIEQFIDVSSAVDAYLLEEIVKNLDMGYDSFYLHRDTRGKLVFGPLWDFDLSLGNGNETCEYFEGLYCAIYRQGDNGNQELSNYWFYGLMTNCWFRQLVRERWNELKFELTAFPSNIIEVAENNRSSYLRNFDMWTNSFGIKHDRETELVLLLASFDEHYNYLCEWLQNRINWLDYYYNSEDFINGAFIVYDALIRDWNQIDF